MALCLFQTAPAHRKATYRRASLQYSYLHDGVLEQGPAAIEAKQALADNCGVEEAVAAQNGGICVALYSWVLEQVPVMALQSKSTVRSLFYHSLGFTDIQLDGVRPPYTHQWYTTWLHQDALRQYA